VDTLHSVRFREVSASEIFKLRSLVAEILHIVPVVFYFEPPCITQIIFLFVPLFGNSYTGQTGRWIFTLDGSNDAVSRKDVPFGVSSTLIQFMVQITPKPQLWGVNRRFPAMRAKY